MYVCIPLAQKHSGTLRVADKMDPICRILHYWINSCLESLHLLPHGLQAGTSVKQVDDCHIRTRMRLQRRDKETIHCMKHGNCKAAISGFNKATPTTWVTKIRRKC